MGQYERYKQLSSLLDYSFEGIKLNNVIALELWGKAKGRPLFSWKSLFKIFLSYDLNERLLPTNKDFIATNFSTYGRKDHCELFETVLDKLRNKPYFYRLQNGDKMGVKFSFHPFVLFKNLKDLVSTVRGSNLSFIEKWRVVCEYIFLCNTIKELGEKDWSLVKKYLCLCNVISLDNLLTQFFRTKGIETFSLQEGIYYIFQKHPVMGSIAYELFATDHLICWGQYTKDEFVAYGINPDRIAIGGYPKCQSIKELKLDNTYKNCLVMLAGPIFGDVNEHLLEILEELKEELSITLKSHPANYELMVAYAKSHGLDIVPKEMTINNCLNPEKYDFCIAVNTTAYYEAWISGVPSIRYEDERFDMFYGFDDTFSDIESLKAILVKYREKPKTREEVKKMLRYSIGLGIDNYSSIINGNGISY